MHQLTYVRYACTLVCENKSVEGTASYVLKAAHWQTQRAINGADHLKLASSAFRASPSASSGPPAKMRRKVDPRGGVNVVRDPKGPKDQSLQNSILCFTPWTKLLFCSQIGFMTLQYASKFVDSDRNSRTRHYLHRSHPWITSCRRSTRFETPLGSRFAWQCAA